MINLEYKGKLSSVRAKFAGLAFAFAMLTISPAAGQSTSNMQSECASVAQSYFRDFQARADMKYNGQRTDGTHAVNGRIFLETRYEDFACSFNRNGRRIVEFFAEGRVRNAYLPGGNLGGSNKPPDRPDVVQVTGVASNDVLNVRSRPSSKARIVGALANGDSVRNLGCQKQGRSNWCRIRMMDDMRSEGWVNGRFLTLGSASHLPESAPSKPPVSGGTRTVQVRFPSGATGTEMRDSIAPGGSIRYVLAARNGQQLYVQVAGRGLGYQIFNPDNTLLLEQISTDREYRGQLWQSGRHVIEVINRSNRNRSFDVIIGIQ